MKATSKNTTLAWWLLISGVVHVLSGMVAAAATSVAPGPPLTRAILPPVEFIVIEDEDEDEGVRPREPDEPVQPALEPTVAPRVPPAPREPRQSPTRSASASVGAAVEQPITRPEPEPVERPAVPGIPGGLRLDPRAVAIAALAAEGPSGPHVSAADEPSLSAEERTAELNQRHSRFLSDTANAQAWITRKEPPKFEARRDGSFVYKGHAFSARIRPDGTIVFSDRDKLSFSEKGTSDGQSLGARFSFDLTDGAYRRRGADPYQAERDYVIRGSEELRDQLMAEYREKEGERALLRLTGRLERTWTSARDAISKRAAIFKLWDDCSDDDVGAKARAAIVAFVAERLPAGGPDAFTETELQRLNQGRRSRQPFQPYR